MGKKLLVALDESENAMEAVRFLARSFTPDHEVTLFNVIMDISSVCSLNSPELHPLFLQQQINFCIIEDKKKELVNQSISEARKILLGAGFPEKNITVKIENRKKGVAQDIIDETRLGYDAVVMGRRGLSGIAEFFIGSVSQKVLHGTKDLSVILVS